MSPRKKSNLQLPANYGDVLKSIKMRIQSAQIQAAIAVNRELISPLPDDIIRGFEGR